MTLEQALLVAVGALTAAVGALWGLHLWHLRRITDRVNECETGRKKLEHRLEALEEIFLQTSCGVLDCDVRKRMSSIEAKKRIREMEKGH